MDEAWRFAPGRGIWSLHRRCDEARLHFSLQSKEKLMFGSVEPSPLTCHRQVRTYFRACHLRNKKKKQMLMHLLFFLWSG